MCMEFDPGVHIPVLRICVSNEPITWPNCLNPASELQSTLHLLIYIASWIIEVCRKTRARVKVKITEVYRVI